MQELYKLIYLIILKKYIGTALEYNHVKKERIKPVVLDSSLTLRSYKKLALCNSKTKNTVEVFMKQLKFKLIKHNKCA